MTGQSVFLQGNWPAESLGRVTSNLYLFTGTASSVGALVLGALAVGGSPLLLGSVAAAGYLLVGSAVVLVPSLRRLRF